MAKTDNLMQTKMAFHVKVYSTVLYSSLIALDDVLYGRALEVQGV